MQKMIFEQEQTFLCFKPLLYISQVIQFLAISSDLPQFGSPTAMLVLGRYYRPGMATGV